MRAKKKRIDPQVTARVAPHTKLAFKEYALSLGVDGSSLVRLLIGREMRRKRLTEMFRAGLLQQPSRRRRGADPKPLAISTHMRTAASKKEFSKYAKDCGLNDDRAAGMLIETELRFRWLERAFSLPDQNELAEALTSG